MATSKSTTAKKTSTAVKPAAKKTTTSKTTAKKVTAKTTTAKTAVAKKPAAKPAAAKKPVATKAAPRKATAPTPEQRYKMVQDAAYFIAEKNGFVSGSMDYWIAAETEITALLSGKKK